MTRVATTTKNNLFNKSKSFQFYVYLSLEFFLRQTQTFQLIILSYCLISIVFSEPSFCMNGEQANQLVPLSLGENLKEFQGELQITRQQSQDFEILHHFVKNHQLNETVLKAIQMDLNKFLKSNPQYLEVNLVLPYSQIHFDAGELTQSSNGASSLSNLDTIAVDFENLGLGSTGSEAEVLIGPKNSPQTPSDDGASFIASYLSQTYPTVKTLFTDEQVCQLNAFEILKNVDMTDI